MTDFIPPGPTAFISLSDSEYTTATDSSDDEDYRPSGPVFIQPRVYETEGAGWQPVKIDGDKKDLDAALNKWRGQESSFGKTETLALKQTSGNGGGGVPVAPGAPQKGMRLDNTILQKLMKGKSLKNTVGQELGPEDNVMSDEEDDNYKRKAGDIYIPGEYSERKHETWRTQEQIERYRMNMAFLNRLKPNHLKPKKQIDRQQLYEDLPFHARGRSDAQIILFLANRARLLELKKKYENYEPIYTNGQESKNEQNDVKKEDENDVKDERETSINRSETSFNRQQSYNNSFNHTLSRRSDFRKSRKARKISVDRSRLSQSLYSRDSTLRNDSNVSFENPGEKEDVEFSGVTTIRRDQSVPRKKMEPGQFEASTIKKNFSLSKADKNEIPRVVKRRNESDEMTLSEFKLKRPSEADTEDPENEILQNDGWLTKIRLHGEFYSKWKSKMIQGSYKLIDITSDGLPVYKRSKKGQDIFLFFDKNKWKISPDMGSNACWVYCKSKSTHELPLEGWKQYEKKKWLPVQKIELFEAV